MGFFKKVLSIIAGFLGLTTKPKAGARGPYFDTLQAPGNTTPDSKNHLEWYEEEEEMISGKPYSPPPGIAYNRRDEVAFQLKRHKAVELIQHYRGYGELNRQDRTFSPHGQRGITRSISLEYACFETQNIPELDQLLRNFLKERHHGFFSSPKKYSLQSVIRMNFPELADTQAEAPAPHSSSPKAGP